MPAADSPVFAQLRLSRYDAVLFDMDGTLVDTEPLWFEAERAVCGRYGVELPAEAIHDLIGLDAAAMVSTLQTRYGLSVDAETFLQALGAEMARRLAEARPRPGAEALVRYVAEHKEARAVVSNSPAAVVQATLEPHPWAPLLPRRFSVDEVTRGKPEPDLYLLAAERLEVTPRRCLVIEDSVTGVTAAVRAGMTCVAVTFGEVAATAFSGLTPLVATSLEEVRRTLQAPCERSDGYG